MILRYTCTACGLVTRVTGDQDHKACACAAPFDVVDEDAPPDPPPDPGPQ